MPCNGSEGSTPDSEPKPTASGEGGGQGPPPPPPEDQTEPRFLRQLAAAPLTIGAWVLHNFPSVVLVGMLVAMLVYALANRRALRVLDLEAGNQMEAVRIGAQAGIDADAFQPDGHHYFDIHHTAADTLDKIRPDDLRRNAAAVALLAWVLAER
jgi:hypothetical protein